MLQGSLLGKLIRIVDCHSYNLLTHISGGCRQNSDKWSESRSVVSNSLLPHGLQGSSVHGIFQPRILEWVVISCSRGSSSYRDWTHVSCVSCTGRQILYHCTTWEAIWLLLVAQWIAHAVLNITGKWRTLWSKVKLKGWVVGFGNEIGNKLFSTTSSPTHQTNPLLGKRKLVKVPEQLRTV